MFITVSGIDGAGKSTLLQALGMKVSQEAQRTVRLTGEPGGTKLGKSIRKLLLELTSQQEQMAHHGELSEPINLFVESPIPLAELLLFSSARAQHCTRIREWIHHGEIVICDRFSDCTWAYQGALGLRDDIIERTEQIATGGLTPDLTFILDIPVDIAHERLASSRGTLDRIEQSGRSYFEKVRERYLLLAERYPERIVVLDATKPLDELIEFAWQIIQKRLLREEEKRAMTEATVTKRGKKKAAIKAELLRVYEEGRIPVLQDIEALTGASKPWVIISHEEFLREHPQFATSDFAERTKNDRVRRLHERRAALGYPALKQQAALGHPQLQKARAVRAAKRQPQAGA